MDRDTGGTGLSGSLRHFSAALLGAVETRLRLLATELEEGGVQALRLAGLGALALFFLGLGIVLATLLLVLAFWDTHRLVVVGALTGLFLGSGIVAALILRSALQSSRGPFPITLEELSRDREILVGQDKPNP